MRDQKRPEAQNGVDLEHRTRERKQKRQRNAGHDVGVRHGNIGERHDRFAHLPLHRVDADGCHGAEERCKKTRQNRNDQRVSQQRQKRFIAEKVCVLAEGEALEGCDVETFVERGDCQRDHGDIEEDEDQNGNRAVYVFHTFAMTSSSSVSPKRFMIDTQTKMRIISTRLIAAPRFGLYAVLNWDSMTSPMSVVPVEPSFWEM